MFRAFSRVIIVFIFFIHTSQRLFSQSLTMPAEGFTNTLGIAVSSGIFLDKNAFFMDFATDYSKVVNQNWNINLSVGYDQEHLKKSGQNNTITNTLTPSLAVGYAFNKKTAMDIGLGKGLFDDDNDDKAFKFNNNGGWTIGLIGVYSFYQKGPHSFDVSGGIERGLSSPETDLTLELGYGNSL